MHTWVRPLIVIISLVLVPLPAWSVIIQTKDGKEYKGFLVSNDNLKMVIRPQGSKEEITLFHGEIKSVVQSVQLKELEKLNPEQAKDYYDYAVTLMGDQIDPEARETALHLFLIAAFRDPGQYGFSALLKMSEIARTADEASAFRAMAYLLDTLADKNTLKKGAAVNNEDIKARESFLKALEMLRRGKTEEALKLATVKGVSDYFDIIPGLMSHQDFIKLCEDNPECTACKEGRVNCTKCGSKGQIKTVGGIVACPECQGKGFNLCSKCKGKPRQVKLAPLQLQLILQLELLDASDPKAKLEGPADPKSEKWSALLSSSQIRPIPVLSLIHLTEYDPRKCLFKDGKWIEPKK